MTFDGETNDGVLTWLEDEAIFRFSSHLETSATGVFYYGDSVTDGSWRSVRSGTNLVFERPEAGAWVQKGSFVA